MTTLFAVSRLADGLTDDDTLPPRMGMLITEPMTFCIPDTIV